MCQTISLSRFAIPVIGQTSYLAGVLSIGFGQWNEEKYRLLSVDCGVGTSGLSGNLNSV